ncbi:MAG TPA: hypothetical protein VIY48_17790, partial [Candidatus Paceibacterota bacterium]
EAITIFARRFYRIDSAENAEAASSDATALAITTATPAGVVFTKHWCDLTKSGWITMHNGSYPVAVSSVYVNDMSLDIAWKHLADSEDLPNVVW